MDGYHDLETVFHRVDIADDLEAAPGTEIELACDDPALGTADNLVLVAARALREKFRVRAGARLTLRKRIPHGAGLGGGSSDAAAALLLLTRLWGLEPGPGDLASIALSVGSDVPFFLGNASAYATSRGEQLSRFPLVLPCTVVVVSPELHVSTRTAFGSVVPREHMMPAPEDLRSLIVRNLAEPRAMRGVVENDFEGPVFREHPAIRSVRDNLYEGGADFALMSGSGSSVFGLFTDDGAASLVAGRMAGEHRVFVTAPGFVPDTGIVERRDSRMAE